jgi:hypothetical protein
MQVLRPQQVQVQGLWPANWACLLRRALLLLLAHAHLALRQQALMPTQQLP